MDHDPDAMYRRPAPAPALPSISDYWPDAPHRMGPAADHYVEEEPALTPDNPLTRRRDNPRPLKPMTESARMSTGKRAVLGITLAIVLLGAAGTAVAVIADNQQTEPTAEAAPSKAPPTALKPFRISGPLDGRDKASFELVTETNELEVRTADLGDTLYQVTTPENGPALPRTTNTDGAVRLFLDRSGQRGQEQVEVLLNQDVRWQVTMTGGVKQGTFDLAGAVIEGVDLVGGATRIDLTLPKPDGTLPIRMAGGVNTFEVRAERDVPVRLRTRRGAGQVTFEGRTDDGVAKEAAFLSPGWQKSSDRIDVDAVAGIGTMELARP
ncbi:hypothetical protein GCM10010435_57050 [Winogradskya consettensis]|uniref:DUF2154 domain-containing protein n=1 Tax=Winogradskya consettensis TaxID=113560 RepID=A0A919VIM3_9ACTN|nr:hypothetical protein [Actinoplanes consettensis]GIM67214.1 hypothetical protein Aco04nite_05270 [Actinoplanes consettensis]